MSRRAPASVLLALLLWLIAAPASAAADGCEQLFPDANWGTATERSGVSVRVAGLSAGIGERIAGEVENAADLLASEIGGVDGLAVCVFGDEIPIDPFEYSDVGARLHAIAFGPEGTVAVSARELRFTERAIVYGLTYVDLYSRSGGYPEPLATAVTSWYASRIDGTEDDNRRTMQFGAFFNDLRGTPWTEGVQESVLVWNPQFQQSPIGDIVRHAVATRGFEPIIDPDTATWAAIEADWIATLEAELLGDQQTTSGWIIGSTIFLAVLVVAGVLALLARRAKRLDRGSRRATVDSERGPRPWVGPSGDGAGASGGDQTASAASEH